MSETSKRRARPSAGPRMAATADLRCGDCGVPLTGEAHPLGRHQLGCVFVLPRPKHWPVNGA